MRSNITHGPNKQQRSRGHRSDTAAPKGFVAPVGMRSQMPQTTFLENRFDLTSQQARLVVHLITGASLRDCGKAIGVEYETARRHVKSAFHKTGTHRQSELIVTIIRAMNEMRG